MIWHHTHRLWQVLYAIVASLILTGCGGGGGGGGPSPGPTDPDNTSTVSGTAAAGAPLIGFVGAKDSVGGTETAEILSDGSFELPMTDLTPPVLIYASGIAGGNAYQLLSVVFENDVNGTVNITPITDLIIGNTVSDSPQDFFNNPNFTVLTQEAVEAEEENLKTRLKPLLDGLGVEEGFDLRNSTFAANRSGFDAVLDILEVTVSGGTATIRSRVDSDTELTNTFAAPEEEVLTVSENLADEVTTLGVLDDLASSFATALDDQDGAALEALVTADYLNNGEDITGLQNRLFGSATGIEDAGELADDIRNWSLVNLDTAAGTAQLNIGAAQGPWNLVNESGDWRIQGNQLEFFAFVEPTHVVQNGAETPEVTAIGTLAYAGFPAETLSASPSAVTVSGDLPLFDGNLTFNPELNRFEQFETLGPNAISPGAQVTFSWEGAAEATYTIRRGTPDLSNGAPEITSQSADLTADEYSFEWTLPPGYDAISVRNNFTGQTSGGEGNGFTGNPLDNDADSFTGELPANYVPSADDELHLIARDPFGVFVAARLVNPFADQVPPPAAEDALIGSWIARNPGHADNAPWVQLTFLESGYYMHQELDTPYRPEADEAGNTGIELGRYEWDNQTGEVTVPEIIIDDNGFWGLTDVQNGEERLALLVDGDTLSAYDPTVGPEESTQFTRVPLNQSGITGSWAVQDSVDPTNVSVLTILEDDFYFLGTTQPADDAGEPGLEFGTFTYDSETLVLNPTAVVDQNGEFGLSDPMQGFDYATVIDGFLIIDDGEAFQLSEIAPGVAPSDGGVTVNYTAPDDGSGSGPGTGISGNYHYLRNFSGIEGQMEFDPPLIFQSTYNHVDTTVADNGDGTGSISWAEICLGDLIVDANTGQSGGDADFEFANECLPSSGDSFDLNFTADGLSASFAEETIVDPEDQSELRRGSATLDMTAVDAGRTLFIGQSAREFGFEQTNTPDTFTDGVEISAHVMSEIVTGRTTADLEGRWGLVTRYLTSLEQPNELEYSANSLIVDVDAAGAVTRASELSRGIIQGLEAQSSFVQIEIAPEETASEPLGPMTITDDGTLGLFGDEFGGILSADGNALFLSLMNPMEPQQTLFSESEWIAGVRLADNFTISDLEGKEYELISQSYWMQPEFFEVDYAEPGASLTFGVGTNTVDLTQALTFPYVPFIDGEPLIREADPQSTDPLDVEVDANGRISLTTDFGEPGVTTFEMSGFATPDARLLVFATTVTTKSDGGTTDEGSIGISYAICTNCD